MGIIIGTAGHIDHGKTALVKALTGYETDRLAEEKERGITIDIGFAFWNTKIGEIAIIDVPGHEKFIRNMVAGITGVDWVLMTIAADEGIMPQTLEHLDIIELLGIKGGIIALTKSDLVEPEWIELIKDDIKNRFRGTCLENQPVIPVSSLTGEGLEELREAIENQLSFLKKRIFSKQVRLHIDREFIMEGYGQVITGTLISGTVRKGNILSLIPGDQKVRVRGIQHRNKSVDEISAVERTSLNLTSERKLKIQRGSIISSENWLTETRKMAVEIKVLKTEKASIRHLQRVRIHIGTAEIIARLRLVESKEIAPGGKGLAYLMLEELTAAIGGDRFIVRLFSPLRTIGGGTVLDPNPKALRKKIRLDYFSSLSERNPEKFINLYLSDIGVIKQKDIRRSLLIITEEELQKALDKMIEDSRIITIMLEDSSKAYISAAFIKETVSLINEALAKRSEINPLNPEISRKELSDLIKIDLEILSAILNLRKENYIVSDGFIKLLSSTTAIDENQEGIINEVLKIFQERGLSTPLVSELEEKYPDINNILKYLVKKNLLIKISSSYFITDEVFEKTQKDIIRLLNEKPRTLSELKEFFNITRKYLLPLIEFFDMKGITKRDGDLRIKGRSFDKYS
ncbi:MAG: selenocysteine-specific translation elongation factor [Candidatus Coatesbacteria bacterium]|nr:selenocysteine-specific translation elongation factor [Candidatus Coatesbacteria bacterium]